LRCTFSNEKPVGSSSTRPLEMNDMFSISFLPKLVEYAVVVKATRISIEGGGFFGYGFR
jgi:hypothetical protein